LEACVTAIPKIQDISEKLMGLTDAGSKCVESAPEEFANLDFMEKAKMIAAVGKSCA